MNCLPGRFKEVMCICKKLPKYNYYKSECISQFVAEKWGKLCANRWRQSSVEIYAKLVEKCKMAQEYFMQN